MQQKSELPEGWAISELDKLISIKSGKYIKNSEYSKDQNKPYPVAGAGGPIGWTDSFNFSPPILTLGRVGAAGNLTVYDTEAWVTDNVLVIQPYNQDLLKWLIYFFQTVNWSTIHTGSSQPLITQKIVNTLNIPLPPLPEQHRIVSAIEALFARLDATNEKLDRVQEILKKFRESVLAAACDGRLTEEWRKENLHCNEYFAIDEDQFNLVKQWRIPTVWSWSTLEDSCSHVVDCPHSTPKWTDIGVYCVRTSELKCGHIDFSNAKYVSEATYLERIKRLKPQEGDILYSREGTVGIASLVPSNVKICLGQRLMLFRTKNNLIPSFFVKVLNSPYIYDSVKKSTMGSTAPRFNVADIKKFPTPLPPLPEQQEIVRRVDALFAFADSIETKVAAAREKTEKLRQSILAKAFSGELVETEAEIARREGRDYETAEVLLERIKEKKGKEEKRR